MSLLDLMPEWLSQSVTIERGGPVSAAPTGQSNKYFATISADVPCQIQIRHGQFFRAAFGDAPVALAVIFFLPDVDVRVADHIREAQNLWMVDAVNAPREGESDHLEVTVHLVRA